MRDLNQVIEGSNWFGSVHGPLILTNDVVQQVFKPLNHLLSSQSTQSTLANDLREIIAAKGIERTTREELIDARVGQGKFRSDVLELWSNRCAVTGSCTLEAIRASHIKPWRYSSNDERLDASNGLPLLASLDALFDAGLISFGNSGGIMISPLLAQSERKRFGISRSKLARKPMGRTATYLRFHRASVFRTQ